MRMSSLLGLKSRLSLRVFLMLERALPMAKVLIEDLFL